MWQELLTLSRKVDWWNNMTVFIGQKKQKSFLTITNLLNLVFFSIAIHCVQGSLGFKVAKPTKTQAKWLDYEVGAIVHFNMQTFDRYMKPGRWNFLIDYEDYELKW